MTEFVKRENEELAKFQQRVNKYGLDVESSRSGHYDGPGTDVFIMRMTTKPRPVKGNKKLIEQLEQDGFRTRVYRNPDRKMLFYVYGFTRIEKEVRA